MEILWLNLFLAALGGYFLGSIPTGYLVGRLWGIDVLRVGSGRTGGTNVLRSVGFLPSSLTVAGDVAKGYGAVILSRFLFGSEALVVVFALAVLVGHNWSLFLRLRGGAGVTPTIGALLGIAPLVFPLVVGIGLLAIFLSKYVSLGSITGAVALLLTMVALALFFQEPLEHMAWGVAAAALILFAHLPNIERLLKGKERRLGEPAQRLEGG